MLPPSLMTTLLRKVCILLMPVRWSRRLTSALVALGTLAALGACTFGQTVTTSTCRPTTNLSSDSGSVYIAASSASPGGASDVQALAAGTGQLLWRNCLASWPIGLASNGAMLFVGSEQLDASGHQFRGGGAVTALVAATGAKAWSQGYGSVVPYPFAATADTVFVEMIPLNPAVGCEDKAALVSVEAIQASNSTVTWSTELPAGICARPILGDGALYVITYAGGYTAGGGYTPYTATLLALDVRDGMPLWRLALDTLPDGGPVLSDGALYAVVQPRPPNNGPPTYTIVAFKASDGMLLWQRRTPVDDPVVSSNVVRNGAARLLAGDGMVFYVYRDQLAELQGSASSMGIAALRASDGTAAWQQPVPYRFDGLQTVQAGLLYFSDVAPPSDQQNHPSMILHSFDAHSGALIFERQLPPTRQFYSNDVPNTAVSDTYRLATLGITGGVVVLSGYAEHYASHSLWGSGTGIVGFILGVGASDGTLRWAHTLGRDVPFSALMLAP